MRRSLLFAALLVAACGDPLPRYSKIDALRVLAVRAEPPEVLLDAPAAFAVRFDALVVDPSGGAVEYAWSFCPVETSNGCRDFADERDAAPQGYRAALDGLRALGASGSAAPLPDAQQLTPEERATRALWPYALPDFLLDLDAGAASSLFLYHAETSFLGFGAGAWPSAVLEVQGATESITAMKRFVLGVRDLRSAAEHFAAELGYTVCPEGRTPAEVPGCLPIAPRTPNTNPVFERVLVSHDTLASAQFDEPQGIPEVRAGEALRVMPVLAAASSEPYQQITTDMQTGRLAVRDMVEEISVTWFCSEGRLQDQLTWPKFTRTLDTVWTAPPEVPAASGGLVTIYMVAQDQRGGTGWTSLEVRVVP